MNLQNKYSRDEFLSFISSFIPNFGKDIRKVDTRGLKSTTEAVYLGESPDLDLAVFELTHTSSSDARITLATEGFKLMKDSSNFRALIAYVPEKSNDWRLSLMTATPDTTQKGKVILKLSNPRRYSFFLGESAKVNTPYQFLIKQDGVADFDELQKRFSLEVVNKDFYNEISQAFLQLVNGQLKLPFVNEKSQTHLEFAVRLIGRIIFCWFLREKKSETGLPLMPQLILSLDAVHQNGDYYHSILEPIFFEVLNKPIKLRRDDFAKEPFSSVPYLNGGLFSPQEDDYYKKSSGDFQSQFHNTLLIPDDWFKFFFEILETYNFTIDENTSYDEELSIDPEMLGRIFENLLAEINPETGESARKSTGSYYTPRTIVNYMVDESLLLYLKDHTKIDEEKLRAIISYDLNDDLEKPLTVEEIEKIIDALEKVKILDPACGSGAFPMGALQKIVFILQQADPDGRLWFKKQIKKTSPEIRRLIEREFSNKNLDYIRKLGIIRENIYGIDIQPIASEISRLRCFLTLIVEQKIQDSLDNRGIEPLPNLDFKFVTANSLISLPKPEKLKDNSSEQTGMFDDNKKIDELKQIRNEYLTSSGIEREQLKSQFSKIQKDLIFELIQEHGFMSLFKAELTQKLTKWDPFSHQVSSWFDPEWMFGINNGFDIVIANPPYVGEKGHKEIFREIKNSPLGKKFYQGKMDLFYFFFHIGLDNLCDSGVLAFITTNYYPTAPGGRKLREDFKNRSIVEKLVNFNELKIFKSAAGQHNMITVLAKGQDNEVISKTCITKHTGEATPDVLESIISWQDKRTNYFEVKQKDLYDGVNYDIRISGTSTENQDPVQTTLSKIKSHGELLGSICNINQGIVTGADKVSRKHIEKFKVNARVGDGIFVLSYREIGNLNLTQNDKQILRPWFKNSDVYRWGTNKNTSENILYLDRSKEYVENNIEEHLKRYIEVLNHRREVENGTIEWWKLQWPRDKSIFENNKITVPQRSPQNTFGYNEIPWYAASDVFFITEKDKTILLKYILALVNSKLFFLWLYHRGKRKGETLELIAGPLSEIPIKKIPESEQQPFIEIVDKILAITKSSDYLENPIKKEEVEEYEKQIDQLVYKLYGLTDEEIKIVENSSNSTKS